MIWDVLVALFIAYVVISVVVVFWKIIWRVAIAGVIGIAVLRATGVLF